MTTEEICSIAKSTGYYYIRIERPFEGSDFCGIMHVVEVDRFTAMKCLCVEWRPYKRQKVQSWAPNECIKTILPIESLLNALKNY